MHTVERDYPNKYEVVFYSGVSFTDRDGVVKADRTVVRDGMDEETAYRLCNYLNGGHGFPFPDHLPK